MDRAWPTWTELRAFVASDPERGKRLVRELVEAGAGSLAEMARLTRGNRMGVWRLLRFADEMGHVHKVRERLERVYGVRAHRRGIGTSGWRHAYEACLDARAMNQG